MTKIRNNDFKKMMFLHYFQYCRCRSYKIGKYMYNYDSHGIYGAMITKVTSLYQPFVISAPCILNAEYTGLTGKKDSGIMIYWYYR